MALIIDTHAMMDNLEAAINGPDYANGGTDALAHIGGMVSGKWTPEEMSDIHDEILKDHNSDYVRGYSVMWAKVYGIVFDLC